MDDSAYHAQMTEAYALQREAHVSPENWKNRFRVSAKLTAETYAALHAYCRKHELSINSALRQIISEHLNLPNG